MSASTFIRVLGIALLCIVLSACAAFNLGNANRFQKGMTPDQVESIASKGPKKVVEFTIASIPAETFTAMVFDLALGSTAADYYAVFRNGKLYYWGHPYEFNRHPDKELNMIGQAAVSAAE